MDGENRYLSTAQVARALGLSVSTVKRWVDDGVLPAHKTVGGHRKVLMADVLRVLRENELPHADISKLFPRSRKTDLSSLASLRDQLYQALLDADQDMVRALLQGGYQQGYPIHALADEVIGPALGAIGSDWESGRIGVMQEHRATQITVSVLYEIRAGLQAPAGRDRPMAVGGAPEGDPTIVPTLLAQMVLLASGWDAVNLGPDTPTSAFVAAMDELKPRLLWLCATHLNEPDQFLRSYADLYREASARRVAVVIGGRGLVQHLRERMPYTCFGDGMAHLDAFARTLHHRPGVPRRGRPPGPTHRNHDEAE